MVSFEDFVITLIGLKVSQNDVSKKVVDDLLIVSIIILWLMGMGLATEYGIEKYATTKRCSKVAVLGVVCCLMGLSSLVFLPPMTELDETPRLWGILGEIALSSVVFLFWIGKATAWIVGGINRIRRLCQKFKTPEETLPRIVQQPTMTTTVTVTTISSSLEMTAAIRNAIDFIIRVGIGAKVETSDPCITDTTIFTLTFPTTPQPPPPLLLPPP